MNRDRPLIYTREERLYGYLETVSSRENVKLMAQLGWMNRAVLKLLFFYTSGSKIMVSDGAVSKSEVRCLKKRGCCSKPSREFPQVKSFDHPNPHCTTVHFAISN